MKNKHNNLTDNAYLVHLFTHQCKRMMKGFFDTAQKRNEFSRRVNQQVQNYKTYLKNSHFGVEKFNFSLGLSFSFFCIDIILLSV